MENYVNTKLKCRYFT